MQQSNQVDEATTRMEAALGSQALAKLKKLSVLVQGLRGIGIESAKNLVLAGPKSLHILDNNIVQVNDLGANFYINQSQVGKVTRAEAVLPQLKDLNSKVDIQTVQQQLTEQIIQQYSVIIYSDCFDKAELLRVSNLCRKNNVGFIYTGNLGLYGFAFVDYGEKHEVYDANGEQVMNAIVTNITSEKEAIVTVHEDKRHGFEDGDTVQFTEVQGMEQINNQLIKIKNTTPFSFTLELDTTKMGSYTGQGIVEQVKVVQYMQFKSLEESLQRPVAPQKDSLEILDYGKFGVSEQLHLVLNSLLEFTSQNYGELPKLHDEEHASQLLSLSQQLNKSNQESENKDGLITVEEFNEELVKNVARYARTNISPCAAFWGGIVAQEVIKSTGKHSPLRQWLHYEQFETLPDKDSKLNRNPQGTRYDDYISIWGTEFMELISKQNVLMVGAGALGCEYLKMLSLMGLSTSQQGKLVVTDDDQIEISNLNRQFLFRQHDIGHSKSERAVKAVKENMNPQFNAEPLKLRICPENEHYFNEKYWNSLDFVVNAVDNINARLFVDKQCTWYNKPLLESGTLGTKCNSQVILPGKTQCYGDSIDPPEKEFASCTLKNFPNQIEHCIQFARSKFEEFLVEAPRNLIDYLNSPSDYIKKLEAEFGKQPGAMKEKLQITKNIYQAYQTGKIESLVQYGRELYQEHFDNNITQLTHIFPADAKTQEGAAFWSGPKRFPKALEYDIKDEMHVLFVQSFTNILALTFGLEQIKDTAKFQSLVAQIKVEKFVPKSIAIKVDDKDTTEEKSDDDEIKVEELKQFLLNQKVDPSQANNIKPTEFEKDDPTNYHVDFVASFSNLRARNYSIKEVPPFQVRLIAGKIIAALATTTAMVVGAVGLEIIKTLLKKPLEDFRNSFMNLAIPLWIFSEPMPAIESKDSEFDEIAQAPIKCVPSKFTVWDKIVIQGPLKVEELIKQVQEKYKVSLDIVNSGKASIYNLYEINPEKKDRLDKDIEQIYVQETGEPIPSYKSYLILDVSGDVDGEDGIQAKMPLVQYNLK